MQLPFLIDEVVRDPRELESLLVKGRNYSEIVLLEDSVRNKEIAELREALYEALLNIVGTHLRGFDREAISLSFFYGMSHDEISALFNVSQSAISQRIVRALRRLRELMSDKPELVGTLHRLRELEGMRDFYF